MNRAIARLLAAGLTVAACGDGTPDSTDPPVTTVPDGEVAGAVTTPPPPRSRTLDVEVLRDGTALTAGATYLVGPQFEGDDIDITLTATQTGTAGYIVPGLVLLGRGDDVFLEPQMSIVDADSGYAHVFTTPSVDGNDLITGADLAGVTRAMPADYLGWFTDLPYVATSEIVETELGGHPARRVDYTVLEVVDAVPCFATRPDDGCVWLTGSYDTSVTYFAGDTGTAYEVVVGADRFVVDVATGRAGSTELAATLAFDPVEYPVPAELMDLAELPGPTTSPIAAGVRFRWRAANGDWYALTTPTMPAYGGSAPLGREEAVSIVPDDSAGFVATPESGLDWWPGAGDGPAVVFSGGGESAEYLDYVNSIPPSPGLPDDLLGALAELEYLDTTQVWVEQVGDVEVSFVEVRVLDSAGGASCLGTSEPVCIYLFGYIHVLRRDEPAVIGVVPDARGGPPMILLAPVSGPGRDVLDSLEIFREVSA